MSIELPTFKELGIKAAGVYSNLEGALKAQYEAQDALNDAKSIRAEAVAAYTEKAGGAKNLGANEAERAMKLATAPELKQVNDNLELAQSEADKADVKVALARNAVELFRVQLRCVEGATALAIGRPVGTEH